MTSLGHSVFPDTAVLCNGSDNGERASHRHVAAAGARAIVPIRLRNADLRVLVRRHERPSRPMAVRKISTAARRVRRSDRVAERCACDDDNYVIGRVARSCGCEKKLPAIGSALRRGPSTRERDWAYRLSRAIFAATPLKARTPIRLGKICSAFIRSPQAQTSTGFEIAPSGISRQ